MFMAGILVGMRPFSIIIDIFLLRLLNPRDFGLIALAMILFNTANLFTDMGMRQAVVQTRQDVKKVSFFAFVIVMLGSMAVTGLVVLFAEPLSQLVGGSAELAPILAWMSVLITIDGLWVVPEGLLRRDLRFKQLALSQVPGELAGGLIAIPLAIMGLGVWSLVIGTLAGKLLRAALLWYYCRPWIWLRPHRWDGEIVGGLIRYGAPTMGSGLLKYFGSQWDTWFVGRALGKTAVGYYSKAFDVTTRLGDMLGNALFGQVLFPSYAKMQDDPARLKRAYLKSTSLVFLLLIPVSLGLLVIAPMLIPVMLGDKWLPMVPVWQVFCLYGMTRPISTNASPLFLAVGKPKNNITASIVLLGTMIPAVLLLIDPYGIVGAAIGVWLAHLVAMSFNVYQVERILSGTAVKTVVQALPFLLAGGLMSLAVVLLWGPVVQLTGGENIAALITLIAIGALVYLGVVVLLQRALVLELYELFIKALGIDRRWPRLLPGQPRASK